MTTLNHSLHIVLLSGGSGERIWPLSNSVFSKQFIRIFEQSDGSKESMIMRSVRFIREAGDADIMVSAMTSQKSIVQKQVGPDVPICLEPCRRDTFPAIVLAASFLMANGASESDTVVICPTDTYADKSYYSALYQLGEMASQSENGLYLLGITPTGPSEKFGYILPTGPETVSKVAGFYEKPKRDQAEQYILEGALWNGGVFAFRLSYMLDKARSILGMSEYEVLLSHYSDLNRISFDYAVVEKEPERYVMRFDGLWNDVGTWDSLTRTIKSDTIGNATLDETCTCTSVINNLGIPVLGIGLNNIVVCSTPDGILVSDKEQSVNLKKFEHVFCKNPRYAEKNWGTYDVIDENENSLVQKITVTAGHQITSQRHMRQKASWTVVSGHGRAIINGQAKILAPGDIVSIPEDALHAMEALDDLVFINVQTGDSLPSGDQWIELSEEMQDRSLAK